MSTVPSRSSTWPTKSHGPAAMKPVADDAVGIVRVQHVAGHLLPDEAAIGLVRVEGPDDVIAIGPGVIAAFVLVVAVRVAVVDHVEPVPAPALAVARRRQQAIDQLLVGVRRVVLDEGVDLLRRRRQAVQVEGQAADQRPAVGLGAGDAVRSTSQPAEDERIDRRADPARLPKEREQAARLEAAMPTTPDPRSAGRQ